MLMIASLLCGLVFGAGLLISGMVQPTKVLALSRYLRGVGSKPCRA